MPKPTIPKSNLLRAVSDCCPCSIGFIEVEFALVFVVLSYHRMCIVDAIDGDENDDSEVELFVGRCLTIFLANSALASSSSR